jgi:hypothetical protein
VSVDINISGIIPPDDKYRAMLALYRQCKALKVKIPPEVDEFFANGTPGDDGMEISIKGAISGKGIEYEGGAIIHLDKLPPNVRSIRIEACC